MPQFRCTAPGCGAVRPRRLPPASCPDKSRCAWEVVADDRTTSPQPPSATTAVPVPVPMPLPPLPQAGLPPLQLSIAGHHAVVHSKATLGRNGDVVPEAFRADVGVSRQHCRLEGRDGAWVVVALSAAPTVLDGRVVAQGDAAVLKPGGHRLVLGEAFEIGVWFESSGAQAPPPAPPAADAGGELDRLLRGGL